MYVQKTVKAGPVIEITKYHTSRYKTPTMPRSPNSKNTSAEQWKVNEKNSIQNLYYIILENFKEEDIRIDLTYKEPEPEKKEAKNRLDNFLRKLRRLYHKLGEQLKWIATTECKGHRIHHHLLVNNIGLSRSDYKKLWPYGEIPYKAFRFYDGKPDDARRVAEYFVKETRETFCEEDSIQKSRYRASRNLKKPEVKKEIIKSKTWKEPKAPKGYYIQKPVQYGYTAFGFPYMFYRMIRTGVDDDQISNKKKPSGIRRHRRRTGKYPLGT